MISYEVRFMSLDAEPWRELVQDRLKLVKQEADVCAWIIDDKALVDILTLAQNDTSSNVLQAPKTIGRENTPVSLVKAGKQHYVAQVEKIANLDKVAYRPIVKDIDVGTWMDLNGTIQARGTRLSVDVRRRELLAMHSLRRKDRQGDRIIAATYQVPTPVERRCRLECEIPMVASLSSVWASTAAGAAPRIPPRLQVSCCSSSACRLSRPEVLRASNWLSSSCARSPRTPAEGAIRCKPPCSKLVGISRSGSSGPPCSIACGWGW